MKRIISHILVVLPAIALQLLFWITVFKWLANYASIINSIIRIASIFVVLYVVSDNNEPSYKVFWILMILAIPVFGTIVYLFLGDKKSAKPIINKIKKENKNLSYTKYDDSLIKKEIEKENKRISMTLNKISTKNNLPITYLNNAKYFDVGEKMFKDMIIELKKAKEFIYLEYFIIENGVFLDTIVDILKEKVKENVDVRIFYDDLGSIGTYSLKSMKKLITEGIKCQLFNPLITIKGQLNNRDHRKMMIIDNRVVYSGGINIADEYINKKNRFNHWKDIGFKIDGDGVFSYTIMFAAFWNAFSMIKVPSKFLKFKYQNQNNNNGYVLSYTDSPTNEDETSNDLFVDLLFQAKNKIYFYTPYLIIGDILIEALKQAAQRGVDVRIIVPGIPDKKIIFRMTRSYYTSLLKDGIKIYEYTPGFLHAKACIVDDDIVTVGTVNLDYRSLFLHFENNSIFFKSSMHDAVENDMIKTMSVSREIKKEDLKHDLLHKIIDCILRLFAPLC